MRAPQAPTLPLGAGQVVRPPHHAVAAPGRGAAVHQRAAPHASSPPSNLAPCPRPSSRGVSTVTAAASSTPFSSSSTPKSVWLQTTNPAAAAAALEAGLDTLVFGGPNPAGDAAAWGGLARFNAVLVAGAATADGACELTDASTGATLGWQHPLPDAASAAALAERLGEEEEGAASPSSSSSQILWAAPPPGAWSLIPTENLVAAAGGRQASSSSQRLFVSATTAAEAAGLLGALETGAAGVVLVTDDPAVAWAAGALLAGTRPSPRLPLVPALITSVTPAGMGDRVCVDLTTAMAPGEGLLVGSFARGLALVQAEVESGSGYVATRPFRVNAGALHSYVAAPGGKTAYLAELGTGDEVLIVNGATGEARTGVVGRAKIERRPLVRVTLDVVPAVGSEGAPPSPSDTLSLMLQNAETVRLVGPAAAPLPPAAAEVVRWVKDGGEGESGVAVPSSLPTAPLRRSGADALRWAMHSTDDSSDEDGEGTAAGAAPATHATAPPDAQDALAWLMRDQDGDGLPDDPDVDVSGMGELWPPRETEQACSSLSSPASVSTTPVSSLLPSVTAVWVWRAPAARHTGIAVDEAIEER